MTRDPLLLASNGSWANPDQIVQGSVWLQFLQISPSYELARKHRTGTLTDADRARLPADFDVVLAVYDDLGDVQRVTFKEWWLAKAMRFFGYQGEEPTVFSFHALLRDDSNTLMPGISRLHDYVTGKWERQGRPTSVVLSIPTCLSRAEALEQVSYVLDRVPDEHRGTEEIKAKYELQGTKYDIHSYFRYLKCIYIRAEFPQAKLWEIGTIAELSTTYSARIAKGEGSVVDQQALKFLASRALNRGLMMAENAARGVFPSYAKCKHAVKFVWSELDASIGERHAWEDEHDSDWEQEWEEENALAKQQA